MSRDRLLAAMEAREELVTFYVGLYAALRRELPSDLADAAFRHALVLSAARSAVPGGAFEDNSRECRNCGDGVATLSSRGWCDGCEAGE